MKNYEEIMAKVEETESSVKVLRERVEALIKENTMLREQLGVETILDTPIDELDFSVRTRNILTRHMHAYTFGDIISHSTSDFLKCHNMGKKSMDEIIAKVESRGFKLKEE